MFANSCGVNNLTMTHDWFQATYVMSMNYRVGKKWVVVPYNVDFPDIRDINNFNDKDKKNN